MLPGLASHIMAKNIERGIVFRSDTGRNHFLKRFGGILQETETACYSRILILNHFYLLLRTGSIPIYNIINIIRR